MKRTQIMLFHVHVTTSSNIASHLPLMADQWPQRCAIKVPRGRNRSGDIDYLELSFLELEADAAAWQQVFAKAGIQKGDRTLVMVKPGLPLIAAVFALFAQGAVPVVIDPGMGLRGFLRCVRHARPVALVGIPLALAISHLARGSFGALRARVLAGGRIDARRSRAEGPFEKLKMASSTPDELAAILFTSGSTGAPKGVCYEHGMFAAQVRIIKDTYGIQPGEIDLPLLPIFALFNPALGMTTIVPEIDPRRPATLDPAKIVQAIVQEQVTNSFGSPTLWRIVADHCVRKGIRLPSLKRVLCAGAPVPASLWEDTPRFLADALLHSPYGATESLPVTSVSSDEPCLRSLEGACVGKPVSGVELRVIALQEGSIGTIVETRSLPVGETGEIIVRSAATTRCYDGLIDATQAAKIEDPRGGVWHRMGDLGFLDAQGRLWFCGRKVERVQTQEATFFTEPCERVFRGHPRARRCALIGVEKAGFFQPAIVVETTVDNDVDASRLAQELRALALKHPATAPIQTFYFHPRFPVDVRHNAKIHRLVLARWAKSARAYEGLLIPGPGFTR